MKENGLQTLKFVTAVEFRSGSTVLVTKVIGKITKPTAAVD
jgi:hypothetical protein